MYSLFVKFSVLPALVSDRYVYDLMNVKKGDLIIRLVSGLVCIGFKQSVIEMIVFQIGLLCIANL